jgi:hypothetical protein
VASVHGEHRDSDEPTKLPMSLTGNLSYICSQLPVRKSESPRLDGRASTSIMISALQLEVASGRDPTVTDHWHSVATATRIRVVASATGSEQDTSGHGGPGHASDGDQSQRPGPSHPQEPPKHAREVTSAATSAAAAAHWHGSAKEDVQSWSHGVTSMGPPARQATTGTVTP